MSAENKATEASISRHHNNSQKSVVDVRSLVTRKEILLPWCFATLKYPER